MVWWGQVFALFGAHLTSFVLGVWVYQQTKSVIDFSLISFFTVLPEVALSLVAGVIVDRWDRRIVMLLSTFGSGLCAVALVLFATTNRLQVYTVYLIVAAISVFQSTQFPALAASIPLLVPRRHLSRANGLTELSSSLAMVASPLLAGVFLNFIGLTRLLLINVATYAFAIVCLLVVRIPRPSQSLTAADKAGSFWSEAAQGWRYVRERQGLVALLFFFAVFNFVIGVVQVLLPPLVLSFASAEVLGIVMSTGGIGVLLGSLTVSIWGGPRRKMRVIFVLALVQGLILLLGVLQPRAVTIGAAAFVFLFCSPVIFTCSQTIWQTKIAAELQGRVFAIRRVVAWSTLPLAYLIAGLLADRIFEPLMATHGPLSATVGAVIGTGAGRGIALLFILLGVLTMLMVAVGSRYRPLRDLEDRLPDVLTVNNG